MLELKKKIHQECIRILDEQITSAHIELKRIRGMEAEETKSSAGDKYETSRAMLFQEKEKISMRLNDLIKKRKTLDLINPEKPHDKIGLGSLVKTSSGFYYLSISLGKIALEGTDFFAISPVSPIGKLINGKSTGDSVTFLKTTHQITDLI